MPEDDSDVLSHIVVDNEEVDEGGGQGSKGKGIGVFNNPMDPGQHSADVGEVSLSNETGDNGEDNPAVLESPTRTEEETSDSGLRNDSFFPLFGRPDKGKGKAMSETSSDNGGEGRAGNGSPNGGGEEIPESGFGNEEEAFREDGGKGKAAANSGSDNGEETTATVGIAAFDFATGVGYVYAAPPKYQWPTRAKSQPGWDNEEVLARAGSRRMSLIELTKQLSSLNPKPDRHQTHIVGIPQSDLGLPPSVVAESAHRMLQADDKPPSRRAMLNDKNTEWDDDLGPVLHVSGQIFTDPLYEVRLCSWGMGERLGMFAKVNIRKGRLITSEMSIIMLYFDDKPASKLLPVRNPTASSTSGSLSAPRSSSSKESLTLRCRLIAEFSSLKKEKPPTRAAFLMTLRQDGTNFGGEWLERIWNSYSIKGPVVPSPMNPELVDPSYFAKGMTLPTPNPCRSIFWDICHVTHCCFHNAELRQRHDPVSGIVYAELYTTTDILRNDEITVFFDAKDDPGRLFSLSQLTRDIQNAVGSNCGCEPCLRKFTTREAWLGRDLN